MAGSDQSKVRVDPKSSSPSGTHLSGAWGSCLTRIVTLDTRDDCHYHPGMASPITPIQIVKIQDARAAMTALIESRSMSLRENDPEYAIELASLAWTIAEAMAAERIARQRGGK